MEVEVLNMASTIQVRVEDELKNKSDALFKDLGTDTTTASPRSKPVTNTPSNTAWM